jgi:hypothetical protein
MGTSMAAASGITNSAALSSHMQTLLGGGVPVSEASAGFASQGQFVSAVHVAHNMNIPFDRLKAAMTAKSHFSLNKAILRARPDLDAKDVDENVKLAEKQTAYDFIQASLGGRSDHLATHIASNADLSARVTALLPRGMTMSEAAAGFKNQGQFIATLQASKNLGVSFVDLKDRMTAGQSLGAAIHGVKPKISASEAESSATQAEAQAKSMQSGSSGGAMAATNTRSAASASGAANMSGGANANGAARVSGNAATAVSAGGKQQ